jgi:putative tricarboxylic transport membrane protein
LPVLLFSGLTIIAPAAPGGGWDQTARVLQQVLARVEPETTVQVENVAGAAGTIGHARFVSSERGDPDALLVTGLVMVSGIITNRAPVSLADTTPIARLTGEYEVIVVPAGSPWHTLGELVSAFKSAPASLAWGGGSAGGTDDLLVRLIAEAIGVPPNQANYIAFPGGGAALAALLGEQVAAGVSGYGEFAGQIESGALRLLAVSSPARVDGINAPTLREQGIAIDLANWRGVVAPPGLTDAERDALIARIERLAASTEWRAVLQRNGWSDLLLTGAPFRQFLLSEQHRIEQVLHQLETANSVRSARPALRLTPMTLPWIALGGGLLLFGITVAKRRADHALTSLPRALLLVGVLALHAIVMPIAGFVAASSALFVVSATLLGSRRGLLRDIVIGFVAAVVLFILFTKGLGLTLPPDPITRWIVR